jgi:lysozyme
MIEGIDVSHWQTTTPPLGGLDFLFARATYGTVVDDRYRTHLAKARAAGLVVGAYHFGRAGHVSEQVDAFLAAAGTPDLLALDLESDGGNPAMTADQARLFIELVQSTGRVIGLYHGAYGYPAIGQDWRWVAKWDVNPPAIAWDVWQYHGGPLDRDRFDGTTAQLIDLGRNDTMVPLVTDETPKLVTTKPDSTWYELDGATVVSKGHAALTEPRPSPYGLLTKRAIFVNTGSTGSRRLVLIAPASVVDVPPPVVDCDDVVITELEAAAARAATAVRTRP